MDEGDEDKNESRGGENSMGKGQKLKTWGNKAKCKRQSTILKNSKTTPGMAI